MARELLPLAYFGSVIEADQVRAMLERHEIPTRIDGEAAGNVLAMMPALTRVQLLVRRDDLARAQQLLREFENRLDQPGEPWYCGRCEEIIEGGFEVCWSCGGDRDEVAALVPRFDFSHKTPTVKLERDPEQEANPYASPLAREEEVTGYATEGDEIAAGKKYPQTLEEVVAAAYRASIIGFFFFPIVMQTYSVYLLYWGATQQESLSPLDRRRFALASVLNILGLVIWGYIVFRLIGGALLL